MGSAASYTIYQIDAHQILAVIVDARSPPFFRMGTALNSRFDVDSDLRFIVLSKQLVFYQIVDDDLISIVRILDGRRDYLSILFE